MRVSNWCMTTASRPPGDWEASVIVEHRLRELAATAGAIRSSAIDGPLPGIVPSGLDARADALVRLAALVAMRAPASSYRGIVDAALAGGATVEEVIGTMIAVASTVGLSRVVPATEGLALGLGYDIEAALERLDKPPPIRRPPPDGW
jgi:alkylhydroperoxidase/carboxymuconolactone decarboxylase family protein YurZ